MCDDHPERLQATLLSRRSALIACAGIATLAIAPPAFAATPTIQVAPGLAIYPRDRWAEGLAAKTPLIAETPQFLLVHHTVNGNTYAEAAVPGLLRGVYRFQTGPEKGWPDVAYNFFVDRFGGVWEGRTGSLAGPVQASATGGSQGFAQLCCFVGDHRVEAPSAAAQAAMIALLAWLAQRYSIDTSTGSTTTFVSRGSNRWPKGKTVMANTISGHRDMSQTECPGDAAYGLVVDGFQQRVTELRKFAEQPSTTFAGSSTTGPPTTGEPSNSIVTTETSLEESSSSSSQTTVSKVVTGTTVQADIANPDSDRTRDVIGIVAAVGAAGAAGFVLHKTREARRDHHE